MRQRYSCATLDRDDATTREVLGARTIDPCRHFWHSPYNISISMWHSVSYRLKYRSYNNSGCVVSLTSRRRVSDRGGRALRDVGRPSLGRTSPAQTPAARPPDRQTCPELSINILATWLFYHDPWLPYISRKHATKLFRVKCDKTQWTNFSRTVHFKIVKTCSFFAVLHAYATGFSFSFANIFRQKVHLENYVWRS